MEFFWQRGPIIPHRHWRDPTRWLFYNPTFTDEIVERALNIVDVAYPKIIAAITSGAAGAVGYSAYKYYKATEDAVREIDERRSLL